MSQARPNPMSSDYAQTTSFDEDQALCEQAAGGDAEALETLIRRHQRWIYNIALRLVLSPADAEDLAQEALIRIVTRLGQYQGRAAFRSWAYRLVVNCFLDGKRRKMEQAITTFTAYGADLDSLPLTDLELAENPEPERALLVQEANIGCMLGMLLCLDREQRVAYVLGEIFEAPSPVAAEILEITPAAFRKRLERARRDLTQFMNEKCGLLNKANPCRCDRKTRGFIEAGWVDPHHLKFTAEHVERLRDLAPHRSRQLCDIYDSNQSPYANLFREHPLYQGPGLAKRLVDMLKDKRIHKMFNLSL